MKSWSRAGTFLVLSALLSSCASRSIEPTQATLGEIAPENWSQTIAGATADSWINAFDDSALTALVKEAETSNFGLEAAAQRSRAAEAAARISRSLRLPSLGAGLRSSRSKNFVNLDPPVANTGESHSLSLSARWELDLWNRLGNQAASAEATYQATQYDFEALQLSLASQVAKSWFNAIEARTQLDLAQATAESYERNLATLERRYERGLVDAFDLRLIRSQAAASRSSAISRNNQRDTAIRSLEILLGRYPAAAVDAAETLPELPPTPSSGIPAQLLARRPDLLAQQNRMFSAFALSKAANRNWLPSLTLTGSDGTLSPEFSDLLESDFNVWSLAADISVALFQSGRLKAERQQFKANELAQIAQYKSLALQAFREVESALRAENDLADLEAQTLISANESKAAAEQSWSLYQRGLVDITAVLDAERRSFDARSQLLSIRNRRLQNRVDLHVALGGDFEN